MNKKCVRCGKCFLNTKDFFYLKKGDKTSSWCIPCTKESARLSEGRRISQDPERFYSARKRQGRSQKLKKYGLDEEVYLEILKRQGGVCAICGVDNPQRKGHDVFIVDHCHITGKVRGLLCHKCNVSVGMMNDDPDVLESGARYLRLNHV